MASTSAARRHSVPMTRVPIRQDEIPILKPESDFFDAEAYSISNSIDEELKVRFPFSLCPQGDLTALPPQKESQRRRDASKREVKGAPSNPLPCEIPAKIAVCIDSHAPRTGGIRYVRHWRNGLPDN